MTLGFRKRIIHIFFIFSALTILSSLSFLLFGTKEIYSNNRGVFLSLVLIFIIYFLGALFFRIAFHRFFSNEIFFLCLFMLTLSLTSVRMTLQVQIQDFSFPLYLPLAISRFLYYLKLFAIFSLFSSTLFLFDSVKKKRLTYPLIICIITMIIIASRLPINDTIILPQLYHPLANFAGYSLLILILEVLVILDCIWAGIGQELRISIPLFLGYSLMIVSSESLFRLPLTLFSVFMTIILPMIGVLMLFQGYKKIYLSL